MLLIGLILMLLPSDMFASMAGVTLIFPAWLNLLAKILAITGALGIVLMTGRRRKNFGLRLALGEMCIRDSSCCIYHSLLAPSPISAA